METLDQTYAQSELYRLKASSEAELMETLGIAASLKASSEAELMETRLNLWADLTHAVSKLLRKLN